MSGEIVEEETEESAGTKYLMCKLGEEIFGIDIRYITDIIELEKITAIPDVPGYVRGVINLRGQVIPIIDIRLRFNMEERSYDDRTVITVVNIHDRSVGFVVDTATEVQDIYKQDISPPPEFRARAGKEQYINGLGKFEDQVVILLDMEKLVGEKEASKLQQAAG
jgi:purine-binding chemotaxis protein CheW